MSRQFPPGFDASLLKLVNFAALQDTFARLLVLLAKLESWPGSEIWARCKHSATRWLHIEFASWKGHK